MEHINSERLNKIRQENIKLTDAEMILEEYEKDEISRKRIALLRQKVASLDWDNDYEVTVDGKKVKVSDLAVLFLHEYASGIVGITEGAEAEYKYSEVINQLTNMVGKFRLEGLYDEKDDMVYNYRKNIESPKDKVVDIQNGRIPGKLAGAQGFDYYETDENGNIIDMKKLVALFKTLEIEPDLNRVRHVVFHEWTHAMEATKKKSDSSKLLTDDTQDKDVKQAHEFRKSDGKVFVNSGRKYYNYEVLDGGIGIVYTGLATREYKDFSEKTDGVGMHNQITEGWVEVISRDIMEYLGIGGFVDYGKYPKHVRVANAVMDEEGRNEAITQFLRDSSVLIERYEGVDIEGRDGLHFLSDYIDRPESEKSFELFPKLAQELKLSREQCEGIKCMRFLSEAKISDRAREELRNAILEGLDDENLREKANTGVDIILDVLDTERETEGLFIGRFLTRLKDKEKIKSQKVQDVEAKQSDDVDYDFV